MKWKRMKPRQKKISNKQEDKTKQSTFLNMQKKSLIQVLLDSLAVLKESIELAAYRTAGSLSSI